MHRAIPYGMMYGGVDSKSEQAVEQFHLPFARETAGERWFFDELLNQKNSHSQADPDLCSVLSSGDGLRLCASQPALPGGTCQPTWSGICCQTLG